MKDGTRMVLELSCPGEEDLRIDLDIRTESWPSGETIEMDVRSRTGGEFGGGKAVLKFRACDLRRVFRTLMLG